MPPCLASPGPNPRAAGPTGSTELREDATPLIAGHATPHVSFAPLSRCTSTVHPPQGPLLPSGWESVSGFFLAFNSGRFTGPLDMLQMSVLSR